MDEDTEDCNVFYSWECVSLQRKNGTTFDIVIPSAKHLMALIHVVHRHIYKQKSADFLFIYKVLKFKMKLAYESWIKKLKLGELV